jgi:hypothetical protein
MNAATDRLDQHRRPKQRLSLKFEVLGVGFILAAHGTRHITIIILVASLGEETNEENRGADLNLGV